MAKTPESEEAFDAAKRAVVTVGDGRGFIIEADSKPLPGSPHRHGGALPAAPSPRSCYGRQ